MNDKINKQVGPGYLQTTSAERLIIALDYSDPAGAKTLVNLLSPLGVGFKVGLELFLAGGPALVKELSAGCRIFLDLKFHDIPNTVAAAVRAAASLDVWMLNVHAGGGGKMLTAARQAVDNMDRRPILVAVTVLTSMDDDEMAETGCSGRTADRVIRLAQLAAGCGLDGVVCSPLEIAAVKRSVSRPFITVSPGIRAPGEAADDQSRTAPPSQVVRSGGDYLVVGRPVTRAADPLSAARRIIADLEGIGYRR